MNLQKNQEWLQQGLKTEDRTVTAALADKLLTRSGEHQQFKIQELRWSALKVNSVQGFTTKKQGVIVNMD